jgi:hypothetical protein
MTDQIGSLRAYETVIADLLSMEIGCDDHRDRRR